MKVAICVPTSGTCQAYFAHSLASMVNEIRDVEFKVLMSQHSMIHANREALVETAIKLETDYILFIDDDMAFRPETLTSLLSRDKDIVACNYPMRAFPIKFTTLATDGETRVATKESSTGIEEVGYVGFGFCLIKTKLFEGFSKPWFYFRYIPETNTHMTEDYPFFEMVRNKQIPVFIDHDASKTVAHVGQHLYRWFQVGE